MKDLINLTKFINFLRLVSIYIKSSDSIQKMIRNYSQKIIDTIGLTGLIELFQTFPNGAEDFVLRLLIVYTNRTGNYYCYFCFIYSWHLY